MKTPQRSLPCPFCSTLVRHMSLTSAPPCARLTSLLLTRGGKADQKLAWQRLALSISRAWRRLRPWRAAKAGSHRGEWSRTQVVGRALRALRAMRRQASPVTSPANRLLFSRMSACMVSSSRMAFPHTHHRLLTILRPEWPMQKCTWFRLSPT